MLPWITYYWFWPTVVVFLFLSHHSLSFTCVPRLCFLLPFELFPYHFAPDWLFSKFTLVSFTLCVLVLRLRRLTAIGAAWVNQVYYSCGRKWLSSLWFSFISRCLMTSQSQSCVYTQVCRMYIHFVFTSSLVVTNLSVIAIDSHLGSSPGHAYSFNISNHRHTFSWMP